MMNQPMPVKHKSCGCQEIIRVNGAGEEHDRFIVPCCNHTTIRCKHPDCWTCQDKLKGNEFKILIHEEMPR